jgi:hypothetical protein
VRLVGRFADGRRLIPGGGFRSRLDPQLPTANHLLSRFLPGIERSDKEQLGVETITRYTPQSNPG